MRQFHFGKDRIVTGKGALKALSWIQEGPVAVLIGGGSVKKSGTLGRVLSILDDLGLEHVTIEDITPDPPTALIKEITETMVHHRPRAVIALGGGSVIDASKVITFLYDHQDMAMEDLKELDFDALGRKTPLVAIPTTSGTGAEVTRAAVITFEKDQLKIGLKADCFIPDLAILDAEATWSMPPAVAAQTGMDAMTHALECLMNHRLEVLTKPMALGAIEGILQDLVPSVCEKDQGARERMHHHQCLAALAFGNVGLGMAHGISHALGGRYGFGHGLLNGMLLPHVTRYNRAHDQQVKEKLEMLEKRLGLEDLVEELFLINEKIGIPSTLKELGLSKERVKEDWEALLPQLLLNSTRSNPVPMTEESMSHFFWSLYE